MSTERVDAYIIQCDGDDCEEVYENPWGDSYFEQFDLAGARRDFHKVGWVHRPEAPPTGQDFCPNHSKAVRADAI